MPDNITNKIIRGTNGRLWINGNRYANVKKYEGCALKPSEMDGRL
ncbi:hypothetical protein [uncultured Succiniclasticum sp.]|jgi:hypothetical protein|nr:hypothetical protein [uncultured Succiniclasticum sp.]